MFAKGRTPFLFYIKIKNIINLVHHLAILHTLLAAAVAQDYIRTYMPI